MYFFEKANYSTKCNSLVVSSDTCKLCFVRPHSLLFRYQMERYPLDEDILLLYILLYYLAYGKSMENILIGIRFYWIL
jgi:hypothetical protein